MGFAPPSSWVRTSFSSSAGSRIDQAARLVECAPWIGLRPEHEPVERVGLIQVAVGVARPPQHLELERAELEPGLRVLRLEVARLTVELQRCRRPLQQRAPEQRVYGERVERMRGL